MNEIVKYNNEMNDIRLVKFSAMDLDMLMLLCSRMKGHNTEELVFSFQELKQSLGISNKTDSDFLQILFRMSEKLNSITGNFRVGAKGYHFTLFPTLIEDGEKKTLTVSVNPRFSYLLNELSKNFTRFELKEFVKLESKYSKNLYRLLKQYRKTGTYKIGVDKFRELMDCPSSYRNNEFMRVCISVAITELSRGYFENLQVSPIRDGTKKGRPIIAYEFTFKPSKDIPGQMNMNDYAEGVPDPDRKKRQKKNKFDNFHQRDYDFDDYERQILNANTEERKE